MSWIQTLKCKTAPPRALLRVRAVLVALAPWPVLILLFQSIPGFQPSNVVWPYDFLMGFGIGMGLVGLWLPGLAAIEPGGLGWVRTFAMGLSLAEFLTGTGDVVRGWRSARIGGNLGQTPVTWTGFTTYLLVSLTLAVLIRRMAFHRTEAERQKTAAEQARQQALRARLAPHFIFNTLNTLHAQIEADPKGAQATTERLADLFRQVTAVVAQPLIPLRQELAFVEAYLGIEQARFGSRLRVMLAVPEALEAIEIPPLSLQVLVENAVKHGVAAREQGGEIRIFADRLGDGTVQIGVDDPGDGSSGNGSTPGTGTALDTLRQRLEKPEDLAMDLVDGRHRVSFRWRRA